MSAGVVELVDTLDLGSSGFGHGGSNPFARTTRAGSGAISPVKVAKPPDAVDIVIFDWQRIQCR